MKNRIKNFIKENQIEILSFAIAFLLAVAMVTLSITLLNITA